MMTAADDHLVNVLGALVLGLTDAMQAAMEQASGLTGAAPAALVALDDLLDGGSVDRLRRAVALTSSGGVRLVDRLEAEGLVTRHPGADGRSLALTSTASGRVVRHACASPSPKCSLRPSPSSARASRRNLACWPTGSSVRWCSTASPNTPTAASPPGGELCRMCDPQAVAGPTDGVRRSTPPRARPAGAALSG